MKNCFLLLFVAASFFCCKRDTKNPSASANGGPVTDMINNPATADLPTDTNLLARISFAEKEFNFGEIKEGEVVIHRFKFTNTGKVPLTVLRATASCGCTVPEWSEEPIPPGGTGEIAAKFNSEGRTGEQHKTIRVEANTYPYETQIKIVSNVIPKGK